MDRSEDKNRQKRQSRRQIVTAWKNAAKALKDTYEAEGKKVLQREARDEAVAIIEEAARTQKDFENVLIIWDEMERIESDRVGKQEEACSNTALDDCELNERGVVIPPPLSHMWWKKLLSGDFLDLIYDCPHEVHELTSTHSVSSLTKDLDENRKEIFYYRVIRQWTPQQIAAMRERTDRNIRKVYTKMIEEMRYELFFYLYWRYKKYVRISPTEKEFVIENILKHSEAEKKEVDWELNERDEIYAVGSNYF